VSSCCSRSRARISRRAARPPPTPSGSQGPATRPRRLGFTNPVGEDGQLGIQGPGENDLDAFPKLYATYERVVISQERTEDAKRPTNVVLAGKLPAGR
jgi:hypothetical protein